jgi:hypothetical protein
MQPGIWIGLKSAQVLFCSVKAAHPPHAVARAHPAACVAAGQRRRSVSTPAAFSAAPPIACAPTNNAPKRCAVPCTPAVSHDPTRLRDLRPTDHRHHPQPQPANGVPAANGVQRCPHCHHELAVIAVIVPPPPRTYAPRR